MPRTAKTKRDSAADKFIKATFGQYSGVNRTLHVYPDIIDETTNEEEFYDDAAQMIAVRKCFENFEATYSMRTVMRTLAEEHFMFPDDIDYQQLSGMLLEAIHRGIITEYDCDDTEDPLDYAFYARRTETISDYPRDYLIAAILQNCSAKWVSRQDVAINALRFLGFEESKVDPHESFKGAFNSAVKRGFLGYKNNLVRRI